MWPPGDRQSSTTGCAALALHPFPVPGTRRNILVHGPLRQYHIMRNRIRLYGRGYDGRRIGSGNRSLETP